MLLAVAGLDEKALLERTQMLANSDWSGFHPAERAAFLFARKLSRTPWDVDAGDFRELERRFDTNRALDVVWWTARCQYMTRVADAFQLPLERENVFVGMMPPGRNPTPPKQNQPSSEAKSKEQGSRGKALKEKPAK